MANIDELRDVQRLSRTILSSAKYSLEGPFSSLARRGELSSEADIFRRLILEIENARISLLAAERSDKIDGGTRQLADNLQNILSNSSYMGILNAVQFRLVGGSTMPQRVPLRFQGFPTKVPLRSALATLCDILLSSEDQFALPIPTPENFRRIVPDQKIAPIQFEISDNKLVISSKSSETRPSDRANIDAAKKELITSGERIIAELKQSNCDKRLLESLQNLQDQFTDKIDAIKIGLMNIGCDLMYNAFEAELPTAVGSLIKAHMRGVQMFVGQFPEWNKFVENAAAADLDAADIEELKSASDKIVGDLKSHPDLVDPQVPRALAYLTELLNNPTLSSKRAAFAMLRSLENLISRVFSFGSDFIEQTAKKTVDKASTAASRIVVGLMIIAVSGALAIGPVAGKIPDMNWLNAATEIVKKQLNEISGGKPKL